MEAKVVVITGANNGIGLGLFKALAERGWRVAGLDLSVGNLPAERSFVCDVTDPGRVERVIGQVVERWGRIDALTRTLAMELEPYGIVVNLVYPLLTRTRSSSPLGIPASFMADPDEVGRTLADKIGSRRSVVTPGLVESVGVFATRVMPRLMGRFLSGRAVAAREGSHLGGW